MELVSRKCDLENILGFDMMCGEVENPC